MFDEPLFHQDQRKDQRREKSMTNPILLPVMMLQNKTPNNVRK